MNAFKISRAALFAFGVALHAVAHADDWHYGVGVSGVFYKQTEDDVWYEQSYYHVRTHHNFAINLDAENQVSAHLRVKVGLLIPQAQYVNANVVSDTAYFAGQSGTQTAVSTTTKIAGVYALLSPEYRGIYFDVGLWLARISVQGQAPAGVNGWPASGIVSSVGYAINPVYGVGYRTGKISISVDWFGISTGPRNSIGHCINCQSGINSNLPLGTDGPLMVATFSYLL